MERRVYLSRLKPELKQLYVDYHKAVPERVLARYGELGMTHCSVHLLGDQIVLIIDAEDHDEMTRALASDPDDLVWQAQVRPTKTDWERMAPIFTKDWP